MPEVTFSIYATRSWFNGWEGERFELPIFRPPRGVIVPLRGGGFAKWRWWWNGGPMPMVFAFLPKADVRALLCVCLCVWVVLSVMRYV